MSMPMALIAAVVAALTARHASAHGWMEKPNARHFCDDRVIDSSFLQSGGNGDAVNQNPRSLNGGLPDFCGDPFSTEGDTRTNFKEKPCSIQATYKQGDTIQVRIELTAQHGGPMTFALCDSPNAMTEECFERNKLTLTTGYTTYWIHTSDPAPKQVEHYSRAVYEIDLKLPPALTCEHCILMWTWWATHVCGFDCDPAECGDYSGQRSPLLYGTEKKLDLCPWAPKLREHPQTFRNCADVAVTPNGEAGTGSGGNEEQTPQAPAPSNETGGSVQGGVKIDTKLEARIESQIKRDIEPAPKSLGGTDFGKEAPPYVAEPLPSPGCEAGQRCSPGKAEGNTASISVSVKNKVMSYWGWRR